jgi:hypothetical protein
VHGGQGRAFGVLFRLGLQVREYISQQGGERVGADLPLPPGERDLRRAGVAGQLAEFVLGQLPTQILTPGTFPAGPGRIAFQSPTAT